MTSHYNLTSLMQADRSSRKVILDALQNELGKTFLDAEPAIKSLFKSLIIAINSDTPIKNLIMHGNGGFGKSEIARAFFRFFGIEPKVIDFHKHISSEEMLGGMNIPIWTKEGKMWFNLEQSMFAHPFLIVEEGLSAPGDVLGLLRNPLSSGKYSQNSQEFEIKTMFIVFCTNQNPQQYAADPDMEAVMQRFRSQLVDWSHITPSKYLDNCFSLLRRNITEECKREDIETLAIALRDCGASPRQIIAAAEMLDINLQIDDSPMLADLLTSMGFNVPNLERLREVDQSNKIARLISESDTSINQALTLMLTNAKTAADPLTTISAAIVTIAVQRRKIVEALAAAEIITPGIQSKFSSAVASCDEHMKSVVTIAGTFHVNNVLKSVGML